jgi:hypothetical protein
MLDWLPSLPFVAGAPPYTIFLASTGGGGIAGPAPSPAAGTGPAPAPGPGGGQPFFNPNLKYTSGQTCRMSIVWDGKGGIRWTMNDQKLADWAAPVPQPAPKYMRLLLRAVGGQTAWDDLTVEGVIIVDPAPAPAPAPAAQPNPGRRRPPGGRDQ